MSNPETKGRRISQADLDNWFTYHSPTEDQAVRYVLIRTKAKELAECFVENCPPGADTTAAVRLLRQAVMTANQAIACGEGGVG